MANTHQFDSFGAKEIFRYATIKKPKIGSFSFGVNDKIH